MNGLLFNVLLAFMWAAVTGDFSAGNLAVGWLLGLLVLFFTRRITGASSYLRRLWQVLGLLLFFLWELVMANVRVARTVLSPGYRIRPGVVAIPLDARTDAEITLLANMITLTPGTLSIDVSADRRELYIHTLHVTSPDDVRRQIKNGFERRIMEVLR